MTKRLPTVRALDADYFEWDLDGTVRGTDDGELLVHPNDLVGCRAVDLLDAMRRQARDVGEVIPLLVSQGQDEPDLSHLSLSPVQFDFGADNNLILRLPHFVDVWEDDDEVLRCRAEAAIKPLLERHGLKIVKAEYDPYWVGRPHRLNIDLGVRLRGQDLHQLFTVGEDACALLTAAFDGNAGRSEVGDLLRGGHASVLIGRYENDWLEAKSQHYKPSGPRWKDLAGPGSGPPRQLPRWGAHRGGPHDEEPVSGAIVDGRARGSFIGIASRHGDVSIPTTAAEIHATLAAGRALLRRGALPADDPPQ